MQVSCLGDNLLDSERGPQDSIIAGEAAVAAVVNALVGDVEWCKKAHGFAEMPARDSTAVDSH